MKHYVDITSEEVVIFPETKFENVKKSKLHRFLICIKRGIYKNNNNLSKIHKGRFGIVKA